MRANTTFQPNLMQYFTNVTISIDYTFYIYEEPDTTFQALLAAFTVAGSLICIVFNSVLIHCILTLVHKKTTFAKILQNSCNQYFCKILVKNTSCKILATILQHFFISFKNFARVVSVAKNAIFARILQDLARHYVLIIYAFHQKASIINHKW